MNEAEWLACDDIRRLARACVKGGYPSHAVSQRQMRHFLCARCRLYWDLLSDRRVQHMVETAEYQLEGKATIRDIQSTFRSGRKIRDWLARHHDRQLRWLEVPEFLRESLLWLGKPDPRSISYYVLRPRGQSEWNRRSEMNFFRDITGNPFRRVTIAPAWLTWNDGTVVRITQAIYEERRFGDMPILADALEESGCTDEQILSHCRGPGPHARGCFVIDLLSGKT